MVKGRSVEANHQRIMQGYLDQFSIGHAAGLIGESGFQNPIDAAKRGLIKNVHVDIEVDAKGRSLRIRDRGTTGMRHCAKCEWGVLHDEYRNEVGECKDHENCPWSAFHALAQIGKNMDTALGSRGMGKSLAALGGEDGIIVRTKIATDDGSHVAMASYFKPGSGTGGWVWDLLPDETWGDSEDPGTEIQIVDLKSELIDAFADPKKLVDEYVLPYWYPAIGRGVTMNLRVKGERTIKIGSKMTDKLFPSFDDKKSYEKISVKMKQKKVGEVTNFNIHLAKKALPEHLRGIAIIKGNKQVIKRITNFGRAIDRDLQDRLFGWVNVGTLLSAEETPNHLDFRLVPLVKKVEEIITSNARAFLEPHNKAKKVEEISEKDLEKSAEIKKAINEALKAVPNFNPWNEGPEPGDDDGDNTPETCTICEQKPCVCPCSTCAQQPCVCPPKPKPEMTHPYIAGIRIVPNQPVYNQGDDLKVIVKIANPNDRDYPFLLLNCKTMNRSRQTVETFTRQPHEIGMIPRPSGGKDGVVEQEFEFDISLGTGGFHRGKNYFNVQLCVNRHDGDIVEEELLHEKVKMFYIEKRPEKPGSEGSNVINDVIPMSAEGGGIDVYLNFLEQDIYFFTKDGPNISPYWLKANVHKRAVGNIFQAAGDALLLQLLDGKISEYLSSDEGDFTSSVVIGEEGMLAELMRVKTQFVAACMMAFEG